MSRTICTALLMFVACAVSLNAQPVHDYTINKTALPLVIDGRLTEPEWEKAPLTENFVVYTDGSAPVLPTQAKMLWDDNYLYVGMIMTDKDVWGEMTSWVQGDRCLCSEEVAEVFIDPDGDGLMYIEIEINPLKTVMDLYLEKELSKKGTAHLEWRFKGLKIGVWVDGTLNNLNDVDKKWVCELALPFESMAFTAPKKNFPPKPGDSWRLNLYRYDYGRTDDKKMELSAWNKTDEKRGFHAPDKFGRVIFSK